MSVALAFALLRRTGGEFDPIAGVFGPVVIPVLGIAVAPIGLQVLSTGAKSGSGRRAIEARH